MPHSQMGKALSFRGGRTRCLFAFFNVQRFTPIQYSSSPFAARTGSARLRNATVLLVFRTRKLTSPAQPVRKQSDQALRVFSRDHPHAK